MELIQTIYTRILVEGKSYRTQRKQESIFDTKDFQFLLFSFQRTDLRTLYRV